MLDARFRVSEAGAATFLGVIAVGDGAVDFEEEGWLVLVGHAGTAGIAAAPAGSPKMRAAAPDGGAFGLQPTSVSETFEGDLRERLVDVHWGAGSGWLYAVRGALISNRAPIQIAGEGQLVLGEVPSVASERTRPADGAEGPLQLRGPSTGVTEPGGEILLEGQTPGAVQLFATDSTRSGPFLLQVTPAEDGSFSVNLLGDNPLPKAPGTWHIYAFSGEAAAGPVTIELTPGKTPW
ncbi:MAG: hypothetical protein AAGA54_10360 [Myxococcota bacterium]